MNASRLLPLLMLMLIPSSAASQPSLNPRDLCPLVQIVDRELCFARASKSSDLCVLLHNFNASFCSDPVVMDDPLSYANLLEKEFLNANDIHKLCPILNFINQELCTSLHAPHAPHALNPNPMDFQFYPKELCPLLNITYEELCS